MNSLKTFIISLPERKDRRKRIYSQFIDVEYSAFEVIDAVKGSDILGGIPPLGNGEIGLWCSTIKTLRLAATSTLEYCLHIAEDDCIFSKRFFSSAGQISRRLFQSDIDILFTDGWARGKILDEIIKQSAPEVLKFLPGSLYGGRTTSYMINAKSLAKVTSAVEAAYESFCAGQSKPMPIDGFYRHCSASGSLKVAVCAPFLTSVSQDPEIFRSDISRSISACAQRWEDIHILASQLPYIEFSQKKGMDLLAKILSDLSVSDTAELINQLVPWLADRGYIAKAR